MGSPLTLLYLTTYALTMLGTDSRASMQAQACASLTLLLVFIEVTLHGGHPIVESLVQAQPLRMPLKGCLRLPYFALSHCNLSL